MSIVIKQDITSQTTRLSEEEKEQKEETEKEKEKDE